MTAYQFATAARAVRAAMRMNQAAFADEMGLTLETYQKIESGQNRGYKYLPEFLETTGLTIQQTGALLDILNSLTETS
jgi:DNA-binding XRE family transcriptional regulator